MTSSTAPVKLLMIDNYDSDPMLSGSILFQLISH